MDPTVADLRLSSFDLGPLEIELVAHGDGASYRRRIDTRTGPSDKTMDRTLTGVHSHVMIPPAYVAPPRLGGDPRRGGLHQTHRCRRLCARGFVRGQLTGGETPGFDAGLRFLTGDATGGAPLSPVKALALWQAT